MAAEIYLDMDGVCVDFIGAAMRVQGYDADELLRRWREEHPGSLFPETLMGLSAAEFFTHEHLSQSDFWAGLVPYPWFEHLYEELSRFGQVLFLTAPTGQPGCVSGKHEWLINQFGNEFKDFIFTRHKNRLAHDQACLVDDMPFHIESFAKRKGHGLLFPQIWNQLSHIEDPVPWVIGELEQKLGG